MRPCFLVIDKEPGITSHDVVAMVRAALGIKKVGHTGTLDPFATGVLPLAVGPATRLIQYLDEDLKVYDATIQLGVQTDTGDHTGAPIAEAPVPDLDDRPVANLLAGFAGPRMQVPPRYSAIKVRGRPLYSYARAGEEVTVPPREIRVDRIVELARGPDWLRVEITCGKGTYARVLAEEIAVALGTVGHLRALRRTRSGPFAIPDALSLPALSQLVAGRSDWQPVLRPARGAERVQWFPREQVRAEIVAHTLTPLAALGGLPRVEVAEPIRDRVRNGARPPAPDGAVEGARYGVVCGGVLIALAELRADGPRSLRVMPV